MRRVLVTHADEPLGRRVLKRLVHDPEVDFVMALGSGPAPRAFDRYLAGPEPPVVYARVDLAKHRPMNDLFHSPGFRQAAVDTVVHLPRHGAPAADGVGPAAPLISGLAERTAEARLVLQHCLEAVTIRHLVALGSAFVYRLPPGNANRLDEESELDLDPDVAPEIRSWIDCDMIFHGEVNNDRLRVMMLRAPTVVAEGGYVYLNPFLCGRPGWRAREAGFDPLCALISDKDVAVAVQLAIHARHSGIYNVAGQEALPLSLLARWTGRPSLPVPGPALSAGSLFTRMLRRDPEPALAARGHLRFGFTLDTSRAESELGFHPGHRIGLARAGDGTLALETAAL